MPSPKPSHGLCLTATRSPSSHKVNSIVIPILQMRKLSIKKFKGLTQKPCSQEDKTRFSVGLPGAQTVCSHCAIL